MPRGPRLILDNSVFHIFNRGNARQKTFHDSEDFLKFIEVLARYKDKFGFKLYHFSLMPNHYHLETEFENGRDLSLAMQALALSYSRYYHSKYNTVGYLWQGRFKNMLVEKDQYLTKLGVYIENNAKKSGLVNDLRDWKWSSYRFYAFGDPMQIDFKNEARQEKTINLIDNDPFYDGFGADNLERQSNYRTLFSDLAGQKIYLQDGGVLGSDVFEQKMVSQMDSLGLLIKPKKRGRPFKTK